MPIPRESLLEIPPTQRARKIDGPEFEHGASGFVLEPEGFDKAMIGEYFRRLGFLFLISCMNMR